LRQIAKNLEHPKTRAFLKRFRFIGKTFTCWQAYLRANSFYEQFPRIQRPVDRFEEVACYTGGAYLLFWAFVLVMVGLFVGPLASGILVALLGCGYGLGSMFLFARANELHSNLRP